MKMLGPITENYVNSRRSPRDTAHGDARVEMWTLPRSVVADKSYSRLPLTTGRLLLLVVNTV